MYKPRSYENVYFVTNLILFSSFGTKFGKRSYPMSVSLLIGPHFLLFLVFTFIDAGNNSIADRISFVSGHSLSIKSSRTVQRFQSCQQQNGIYLFEYFEYR